MKRKRKYWVLYRYDNNNRVEKHTLHPNYYEEPYPCRKDGLYRSEKKIDFLGNHTVYGWKSVKKAKAERIRMLKEEIARKYQLLRELRA